MKEKGVIQRSLPRLADGKTTETADGSKKRDRSSSPKPPFKRPMITEPEYVSLYYQNHIEPLVDENADYVQEPRPHGTVIPDIKTDTIFDQYNRALNRLNDQIIQQKLN